MKKSKKIMMICITVFVILWGLYAVTRYSDFTTYIPFSGRVFSVEPEQADLIFVQNGTTGEQMFFETSEEKERIAQELNDLHYRFWIPTLPIAKGGWSYRVAIETDGKQYSYTFGSVDMTVNGIAYVFSQEQLDALRQYVEE